MSKKEFRETNKKIWKIWAGGFFSTAIGAASIWYGSTEEIKLIGKILFISFGIFLQIPLGYLVIYKLIVEKIKEAGLRKK